MDQTKYYPAYLVNSAEYDNATACLTARGCTEDEAQKFIALAQIHQSEIVLRSPESPPDDFFLVIARLLRIPRGELY